MLTSDQRTTPNLWYVDQAEEAARYYVSIFKDPGILTISRYRRELRSRRARS